MKICTGKEEKGLKYKHLRLGDVFSWSNDNDVSIMIKTHTGHTYLVHSRANGNSAGTHWENFEEIDSKVFRYPNVCIVLGDPE